jgi:hypothetical protein
VEEVPLTVNSWGGGSGTWRGTSINGISETGHHESYAFMNWGDGQLRAQRHGTWTLRPNGGGCVTVRVKNDLVQLQGGGVLLSIGKETFTPSGEAWATFKDLYGFEGGFLWRRLIPPGPQSLTITDTSGGEGRFGVYFQLFGGLGGSTFAGAAYPQSGTTVRYELDVPPAPGDVVEPEDPGGPSLP